MQLATTTIATANPKPEMQYIIYNGYIVETRGTHEMDMNRKFMIRGICLVWNKRSEEREKNLQKRGKHEHVTCTNSCC